MIGRLASVAVAARLSLAFVVAVLTGCYDVPKPACGFVCGPGGSCPADYACNANDGRCHLAGSPDAMVCPGGDAGDDPDFTRPRLVSQNPPDGAVNVDPFTTVLAVFSEDVVIGADAVVVTESGNRVQGFVEFAPSTFTASFTPAAPFISGGVYAVTITSDIYDYAGNSLENPGAWTFTVITDTTPPSVMAMSPPDQAAAVSVTSLVTASFSEDVVGAGSATFLVSDTNGPVAGTVTYSMLNRSATFAPSTQLAPNMLHTVTLTSGISDVNGNTLANAPVMWTFTTGADTEGPMIYSASPSPNQPNVPLNSTINVTFTEQVVGVSAVTFTVSLGGTPIAGAVTYDAATRTATFTPSSPLAMSSQYSVMLGAGITDGSGNMLMSAPFVYYFETSGDVTAPTITARMPISNAINVGVDDLITATFSESVNNVSGSTFIVQQAGTSVSGTVSYDGPSNTATFAPDLQLMANTVYTVTHTSGIYDDNGNALALVQSTFTTGADTAPPELIGTLPLDGATGIGPGAMIVVMFDEPVQNVTTTTFTLDNGVTGTIAAAANGRDYTFTPSSPLTAGTTYTVTLATAITDAAGTPLAAPLMFSFSTAP